MYGTTCAHKPELRPQTQTVSNMCQRPPTAEVPIVPPHIGSTHTPPFPWMTQRTSTSTYKYTTTNYSRT